MFNGTYSVLLIEDEAFDAHHLKRRLKSHAGAKISVTHVETLASALTLIDQTSFDVFLIDMNLPDSQGLDTVRRLIKAAPQVAAIVLSGLASDETAKDAVREGAQDYIVKSHIDHTDVLKSIEFAIERQRIADELRKARDREKKHAQFKSDFLAQMSHEIRTPMNGVIGMTSLLLASPGLSVEDRERVETIKSSGESLLSILNDVLDISKFEAGMYSLQASEFNVRSLIEECLETFTQTISVHHITLTNIVRPEVPRLIRADVQRLRQILTNLISNALKFTKEGYVCVTASIDETDARKLRFEVKDTGCGIDPMKQSKLFSPFVQAETSHQFSGTGLGLTICKNLVELMGGHIGVQSAMGLGSTFWFTIDFAAEAEKFQVARPDFTKRRVLIVGLSEATNQLLKSQLQLRGFLAVATVSSFEDFAVTREPLPDLIIINTSGFQSSDIQRWRSMTARRDAQGREATLLLAFDDRFHIPDEQLIRFPLRQSILYRSAARLLVAEAGIDSFVSEKPGDRSSPQFQRSPLTVLVVDDGAVNRKVAAQMLMSRHHKVDTAEDGTMALTMLESKLYDLIFMDCRMPGLSGLETTRRLRESKLLNAETPIIALTANAFPEDRDQCYAAGMNDFLAKPIVLEDLERAMERCARAWVNRPKLESVESASEERPAIDASTLTMLKNLEPSEGSSAFLDDLIETFAQDTPEVIDQVISAIELGRPEAIQHYAHKLKGYARNLGALRLAELAGNIENDSGASSDLDAVAQQLRQALSVATAELSHWHSRNLKPHTFS